MKTIATELQIKLAPHFWPEGIPMEEKNYGMHARMARIKEYNRTMPSHHQLSRSEVEARLIKSGYDHKLAALAYD